MTIPIDPPVGRMGSLGRQSAEADGRHCAMADGPANPSGGLPSASKEDGLKKEEEEPDRKLSSNQETEPDDSRRRRDSGPSQDHPPIPVTAPKPPSILSKPNEVPERPEAELDGRPEPSSDSDSSPKHRNRRRWIDDLFKRFLAPLSPVVWLENKSSVARDHLANERTFLAWFRTSLSLTSIGIALAQLSRISKQIRTNQINRSIGSIQPLLEPLLRRAVTKRSLVLSGPTSNLEGQASSSSGQDPVSNRTSIESLLARIDHNLLVIQASLDRLDAQALEEDRRSRNLARWIGLSYVCLGSIFLFIGTHRYFRVQSVLQTGQFPLSRKSVGFTTFVVTGLLVATVIGIFTSSH